MWNMHSSANMSRRPTLALPLSSKWLWLHNEHLYCRNEVWVEPASAVAAFTLGGCIENARERLALRLRESKSVTLMRIDAHYTIYSTSIALSLKHYICSVINDLLKIDWWGYSVFASALKNYPSEYGDYTIYLSFCSEKVKKSEVFKVI